MQIIAGILGASVRALKRVERGALRPLAQAVRLPRHRRASRGATAPATDELLVALLRERIRDRAAGAAGAAAFGDDVDALVRGLVEVPPRSIAATPAGRVSPVAGEEAPARRAA